MDNPLTSSSELPVSRRDAAEAGRVVGPNGWPVAGRNGPWAVSRQGRWKVILRAILGLGMESRWDSKPDALSNRSRSSATFGKCPNSSPRQVGCLPRLFPARIWVLLFLAGVSLRTPAQIPAASNAPPGMALVRDGIYKPLFRGENDPKEIPVQPFYLDICPVTNGDFLAFVRANPKWRRSQVKRLFADESYLQHWKDDLAFEEKLEHVPVTFVSWFAAKAYAQWKGKRLPSVAEWEYVAAASPTRPDGENDAAFQKETLRWYATPAPEMLPQVGAGRANLHGARDLHGLVWEWVSDFNTAMVTGDARGDTGLERQLFCGAGAQGASDRANYAAFMRYGLRSSLKADYALHNLGFRCAKALSVTSGNAGSLKR